MCFAIVYWICTSLLVTELYLANAFPVGVFSLWASSAYHGDLGTFDYVKAQAEVWADTLDANKETTYCQNEKYDFKIMDAGGDEFDFRNVSCVFLDHSEVRHRDVLYQQYQTCFTKQNQKETPLKFFYLGNFFSMSAAHFIF